MLKKLFVVALFALPMVVFAQEVKIAHVNTSEIFNIMPEVSAMETQLMQFNKELGEELKRLEEEFSKKYSEFIEKSDSLPETIKTRRMQEVQGLQQRIETFYQQANQDAENKRKELLAPIEKKIADAIKAVGDEQGYTYVMQDGVFLYISPRSIDATPLVKSKLGLK